MTINQWKFTYEKISLAQSKDKTDGCKKKTNNYLIAFNNTCYSPVYQSFWHSLLFSLFSLSLLCIFKNNSVQSMKRVTWTFCFIGHFCCSFNWAILWIRNWWKFQFLQKIFFLNVGCGFIGRHLVKYLINNDLVSHVRAVDKTPPQLAWLNNQHMTVFNDNTVEFFSANLMNEGQYFSHHFFVFFSPLDQRWLWTTTKKTDSSVSTGLFHVI